MEALPLNENDESLTAEQTQGVQYVGNGGGDLKVTEDGRVIGGSPNLPYNPVVVPGAILSERDELFDGIDPAASDPSTSIAP